LNIINKSNNPSLRKYFKIVSSLLIFFIIIFAGYGYQRLSTTQSIIKTNLNERNNVHETLHILRASLLDTYQAIDAFLLEPAQQTHWDDINTALEKALLLSKQLAATDTSFIEYEEANLKKLYQTLRTLEADIDELIEVRLVPSRQYPSLGIGSSVMQPNRNLTNNAFGLALNALNGEEKLPDKPEVHAIFMQARHLWGQVLSNFRLYLANRVGSFDEKSLPVQEEGIVTLYAEFRAELGKLQPLIDEGVAGFETSDAFYTIIESSEKWFAGFQEVKVIHATAEWRIDAKIMKEKISPSIELASDLVKQVNNRLVKAAEIDIATIGNVASQQSLFLWLVACLAILFVVSIFISVDKLIFIPISLIAQALKREMLGKPNKELPVFHSRETRDLVDAFSEMSRQIHIRQSELEYRALHDGLTSLPNRTLLYDHIEHDITISERDKSSLSLLMIDLDHFKEVNDTLGHHVGDQLLIEVGIRLKALLRDVDTVARMGGDEFSVLLHGANRKQAMEIARKIFKASQLPYDINGLKLIAAASVGIAVYPEHGHDAKNLLQHADVAMYVAKQNKLGYSIYDEAQDNSNVIRFEIIADLQDALRNDELELYFQPKLDLRSRQVVGAEVLLRWQHPQYGFVSPEQIIEFSEHAGLISDLTYWITRTAISQLHLWQMKNIDINISINISAYNLKDEEFLSGMKSIIGDSSLPCDALTLEITENAMMLNPMLAVNTLSEFSQMGFNISVDDYGTGFSSLSYLSKLPIDELKIDKSFVMNMDVDTNNETIVRSTIELAHNLGLKVVAEGIETELVWNMLRSYGCDQGQGFLMSQPIPADQLEKWLKMNLQKQA